ncbi:hypothetical protein KIH39_11390 [Telmatocola sphagniphila]|uniref:LTXXQ motif family protein n=1 Tax=Telmatocola sphagniphila TaxID=1123043 RepID=A0A8E6BAV7_9BACT|nr:hypothetical protein [Telmatocola sphagniphila]QVL34479.1 hypothetical protein KIH39_11390 [Telmatocola sphagniphila]
MIHRRLVALVCGLALLSFTGVVSSQEKEAKKDKTSKEETSTKARGQLPQNWAKLGLSDEQKQKVYKTQSKYRDQIDELQAKIKKIRDEEHKDLMTILTEEQKKRLIEIKTGEKK